MLLLALLAELRRRSARLRLSVVSVRPDGLLGSPRWIPAHSAASWSLAINLALVLGGAVLGRRTFTVVRRDRCGSCSATCRTTCDSWLFPIALSAIGLAIVYLGIWWNRNEATDRRITSRNPAGPSCASCCPERGELNEPASCRLKLL